MIDLSIFKGKKVLLLVGPVGWFFYRLAKDLRSAGAEVYKINFSGGDLLYYPFSAVNYRGKPEDFPEFLKSFVEEKGIDTLIVFNDCKEVHRIAKTALKDKVELWVLERGYIRPNFFTFERGGINGYSKIPKNAEFYQNLQIRKIEVKEVGEAKLHWYILSVFFFLAYILLRPFFPSSRFSYKNILWVMPYFIKTVFLQVYYSLCEKKRIEKFIKNFFGKYYFVPLQVFNDSQVRFHSDYKNLEEFIEEVIESFAKHAPKDTYLVFKHHPMDLGFKCYRELIDRKSKELGIGGRVFYFKSYPVERFLEGSIGCVTINSTVGLTALRMYKPVKVMGRAIYNVKGMVFDESLDVFWKTAMDWKVDKDLVEKFIYYLIKETQVNGCLYKKGPCKNTHTGACYGKID
ncbi:capsular polysaccharide export protein, LipB/KpsS family [Thermocrinis sp.]